MKRILITGANKGIGLATVKAILTQQDDAFVLLGSRDPARGAAALEAICLEHPEWADRLAPLSIDVGDARSVENARNRVIEEYDTEATPLYGIVNNAGIGLGSNDVRSVIEINTRGVKRVCDTFLSLIKTSGRIVNVSSASGPKFVSECSEQRQSFFKDTTLQWSDIAELIDQVIEAQESDAQTASGLDIDNAYGFSKACASLYTILLARDYPHLQINACTPGYIETDLTRPQAERNGVAPSDMGMKAPIHGTISILHLLFGSLDGNGHYYGSDGKRSPLDRYRAPGSPEYRGE